MRDDGEGQEPRSLHIVHLVVTTNFAGVERYLTYVAPEQVAHGHRVEVIGGNPERMAVAFQGTGAVFHPAGTMVSSVRLLLRLRRADIVHVHMTAAEVAATIVRPLLKGKVVSTRHFAHRRGSSLAMRLFAPVVRRALDLQISISKFVADSIGEPSVVVLNGVPNAEMGPHDLPIVLVAQRLEPEKRTELALGVWERSGVASLGWRLQIAGQGSQAEWLQLEIDRRGLSDSVDMLGFRDDVKSLMSRSRVLLATAPNEPFGLTVAEAMACGLPVIAASGGAHSETVGVTRPDLLFLGEHHSATSRAAELLHRLANEDDRRVVAGKELRQAQRASLTTDVHAQRLEGAYRFLNGADSASTAR